MAPNKSNKKIETRSLSDKNVAKGVANGSDKGLMSIAEVRMLIYIIPIATVLALIVYIITR